MFLARVDAPVGERGSAGIPPKQFQEQRVGVKKTGKGRRKLGRKKRRMRAKIRHRK
jgi:hypothetical protein